MRKWTSIVAYLISDLIIEQLMVDQCQLKPPMDSYQVFPGAIFVYSFLFATLYFAQEEILSS